MSQCFSCRLLKQIEGHRTYTETDDFIIFEYLSTMTPILVAREHKQQRIPFNAFTSIKEVAIKLFGEAFCFAVSPLQSDHYFIKVIRLLPSKV